MVDTAYGTTVKGRVKNYQGIRTTHKKSQKSKIVSSSRYKVDNLFSLSPIFLCFGLSTMWELFSQWQKLSGNTQYAGVHWTKVIRAPWLGIPIFGSNFWDPHCKRNSDSVFGSKDSGWIFSLKFQCLESQKIGILICNIWNSSNFFAQELSMSYHC